MTLERILLGLLCVGSAVGFTVLFVIWFRQSRRLADRLRLWEQAPLCPACGYAMAGLTEARCPECGASYSLEELWQRQRDLQEAWPRRGRRARSATP